MKYYVDDLDVVESYRDGTAHYLICKFSSESNSYCEIFTGEEFRVDGEYRVFPLKDYYKENYRHYIKNRKSSTMLEDYPEINECYRAWFQEYLSHYVMDDEYSADSLAIGNLRRVAALDDMSSVGFDVSSEKYIFEVVTFGSTSLIFREIFTGMFSTGVFAGHFETVNSFPLVEAIPELRGQKLSKLDLILLRNGINQLGEDIKANEKRK